jgi:hypothetical protein
MWRPQTFFLILVVTACICSAGCTQLVGDGTAAPAVPTTGVPTPLPTTPVPAPVATTAPREVVTVIHYVSPLREVKDSYLLFSLQVPVAWDATTRRLTKSDTPDYRTDFGAGNAFSVYTYYFSQDKDRAFREEFRQWSPAPNETTVTINGITYDRFESTSDGKTNVSYIMQKSSANERGYVSVLVFTVHESNPFNKEDYEKVVASFRSYCKDDIGIMPGVEIPLYDLSGNAVSHQVKGDSSLVWGAWEGDSSGEDSPSTAGGSSTGGDSSGAGSSGGGGHCSG